jgi:alpha,alpha-trehalase
VSIAPSPFAGTAEEQSSAKHGSPSADASEVRSFIHSHWQETVRHSPVDDETLLGLPHPYTIPTRKGAFQELYYWDTYFTCLGLLADGRSDLALANTRNLLAQVARFGFVPNGNRTYYLSRSQPPYLAAQVALVSAATKDPSLLREAIPLLEKENLFWTNRRDTPTGLAHHGQHATREELIEFFPTVRHRLGLPHAIAEENLDLAARTMAECETGWDLNSRFDRRCPDFCPVDLNSTLWMQETLLARWTSADRAAYWRDRAEQRRQRLNELCWDEDRGAWFDYDHVRCRRSGMWTAATFQPLWTGLATNEQARAVVRNALPKLEFAYGVSSVAPTSEPSPFQWDHPNAWPCIQHLVMRGLVRYGYLSEARRIAEKYVSCVCRAFARTGDLWEKYNVLDGSHHTKEEAGYLINPVNLASCGADDSVTEVPPSMMGWTAGAFIDAVNFLEGQTADWISTPR